MFHSAILRLTGWYLLLLMCISLLFSLTIYRTATTEVNDRLAEFQNRVEQPEMATLFDPNHRLFSAFQNNQRDTASRNILMTLAYVNLLIFFGGGLLSYALARRTLRHIEQSHEAQSRFTSDASHELRTPLAVMKTELEVALRDSSLTKNEMKELLESNLEEVNKLTNLSKTLLQLSKLDYENIEIQPVNLGDTISEVIQRYDKNVRRIKFTQPKSPLIVRGNLSSIEELVTILVDNALKYSPEKSKVKITLSKQGKNARFEITNGGKGIPDDKLPHVFDRFYRANESRTDGGSGLGLALAKEIIALHKGELSVSSVSGGNTTFQFSLPTIRKN